MKIKPTDWSNAFAHFAANSYDAFRAIPNQELKGLKGGYKLLGQVTYKKTEVRAVIINGNIFVQAVPLEGTSHDLVEEYVAHATPKTQGQHLPKEVQQQELTFVMREQITSAAHEALAGLTPKYIAARAALAKYSPVRVVTTDGEMPKGALPVKEFDDIRILSKQVESASKGGKALTVEDPERAGQEILRVFGTTATLFKFAQNAA